MSEIVYESELYHHGVLGQKWGVRRYQNTDGSLTSKGKAHAKQMDNTKSVSNKSGSNAKKELTSEEKAARSEHRKEVAKKVAKGAFRTAEILAAGVTPLIFKNYGERITNKYESQLLDMKLSTMPTIFQEVTGELTVVPPGGDRYTDSYTVSGPKSYYYREKYGDLISYPGHPGRD